MGLSVCLAMNVEQPAGQNKLSRRNALIRRRVAGAAILDLAISTLFIWNLFVDPLTRDLGVSLTQANYVFSLGLATFSLGVIVGGALADRIAPRRLAIASGAGMVIGLALAAAAPSFMWIVLGFGVLQGSAAGLGYATAVHEAGIVNHGLALALVVSAYAVGSAALAWPIARLIAIFGYSWAFAALALFCALACGIAATLLPGNAPRHKQQTPNTRTGNHKGVGGLLCLFWLMFGLGSVPGLTAFALAGTLAGTAAYGAVIAVNIGNLCGRLMAGFLADRFGTGRTLHGNGALLVAGCLLLVYTDDSRILWLGLLIIGLQYGALSTLTPLAVRSGVPMSIFGRSYGIVFSAWGLCGLTAPVAGAALIGFGGTLWAVYGMLACGLLSWLAVSAALRRLPARLPPQASP